MFVSVSNLDFSYVDGSPVLRGISLGVRKGETLAIVGASGCGKSTLLRLISGILPNGVTQSLGGTVALNGQTADEYRKSGRMAFMFQEPTLMPNLTVRDNVAFPLKIQGKEDAQKVDSLLTVVGLSDFADYLPKQLSGGMKTRVALARSFVTDPEMLFLDEPFAALDIAWKSRLYVELESLVERSETTVIFVTHDVQEALLLSDNVLVFGKSGNVKASHKIETARSISDRVKDISGFMAEVYENYMLPIQDALMNGESEQLLSNSGKSYRETEAK